MPKSYQLPTAADWQFSRIANLDRARADALDSAMSPTDLVSALAEALDRALAKSDLRLGRETASGNPRHYRIVIQFSVGALLYDVFFNARTGYRAHFRAHHEHGLEFNARIVGVFRKRLQASLPDIFAVRALDSDFQDRGRVDISKGFLVRSLDLHLSKVWTCTKRIAGDGRIDEFAYGIDGAIDLADGEHWVALCRDDDSAWLDVKGAFLGEAGPYQPKDPVARAKCLQSSGSA